MSSSKKKRKFKWKIWIQQKRYTEEDKEELIDNYQYHETKDLKKDDVEVIDYEYCGYNYRAFDIVNHFNEWCGFDLNWDNFPNEDTQRRFLKIYYESYYDKKIEEKEMNEKMETMIEDLKWFDLASNYYWGVWALIQAALSSIDFNYNEYANLRFKRYFVIKNQLLGKK